MARVFGVTALLASVALDRAADQIAKTGLEKGAFVRRTATGERRYCTFGALRSVLGEEGVAGERHSELVAQRYVEPLLGMGSSLDILDWSDAPSTTSEMVVDVLRHAASVARLDEAAA